MRTFTEDLASKEPVPGGGGSSAAVGALAMALGMMVSNLTIGKKKYAADEEEIRAVLGRLSEAKEKLLMLVEEDAKAFEPLAKAYGLPQDTPEEKEEKADILQAAYGDASRVPIRIMETILPCMQDLEILGEKGSTIAVSDVGVGILFAQAALEGASLNILINTKPMKDRDLAADLNRHAQEMIDQGAAIRDRVYNRVQAQIKS